MKSLEELKKLRDLSRSKIEMRNSADKKYRVVVGMATCGIAAGARPVLNALVEESAKGVASVTEKSVNITSSVGDIGVEANSNMDIANMLNVEVNKFKLE